MSCGGEFRCPVALDGCRVGPGCAGGGSLTPSQEAVNAGSQARCPGEISATVNSCRSRGLETADVALAAIAQMHGGLAMSDDDAIDEPAQTLRHGGPNPDVLVAFRLGQLPLQCEE